MYAVVKTPICPLYSSPRKDSPLADEALLGMTVQVVEKSSEEFWKIRTPYAYEGYAPADCLEGERVKEWESQPKQMVLGRNFCDVTSLPDFRAAPVLTLPLGATVAVAGAGTEGWQSVMLPDGRRGYVRAGCLAQTPGTAPRLPEAALRRQLTERARWYLRAPYRWGGKTPVGIDCSGLVSMAYLLCGIVIWRDAQLKEGFPIHKIDPQNIKPGDLLYFPGHIAMYLGDGRYIHSTGAAGSDGVVINSLDRDVPDYRADLVRQLTAVGSYF